MSLHTQHPQHALQTVVIRADASPVLATGHIMRCLTLAKGLTHKSPDVRVIFISNSLPKNLSTLITQASFELVTLPFDIDSILWQQKDDANASIAALDSLSIKHIDLLVVDHYLIDYCWQQQLKSRYRKLLVIDDLANRIHIADYLLDQTLNRSPNDYLSLIPPQCQLLIGQNYMLLREEFTTKIAIAKQKRQLNISQQKTINLVINLGGIDQNNITEKVLKAIINSTLFMTNEPQLNINVIMASQSPHLNAINSLIKTHEQITLIIDCQNMAVEMLNADIAIGACGTSAWERCCLGLPTLAIVLADNQQLVNENLAKQSAIINLGHFEHLSEKHLCTALKTIIDNNNIYQKLVKNSFDCCDGLGIKRTIERLTSTNVSLKLASEEDLAITFSWQSNPEIRRYSRNPKPIEFHEHKQWFLNSLKNHNRYMYIIQNNEKSLGVLRLDKILGHTEYECYEISILIAPEAQGQKLALKALHAIPEQFNHCEIFAHVHVDNHASHQIFRQANYIQQSKDSYLRPVYSRINDIKQSNKKAFSHE